MRLHRPTPWARQQIPPNVRKSIEATEPKDYLVSIGRGSYGWTCRILTPDLRLMGEAFAQPSIEDAFTVAFARLPDTVEWRGTTVEVVD